MQKLISQLKSFTEILGELKNLNFAKGIDENHATIFRTNWSIFRESLEEQIEEQDTSDKLSIFIKGLQKNLTTFSNDIFALFKKNETTDCASLLENIKLFREIGPETIEILDYIQNIHSEYFDLTADISLWKIYTNEASRNQSNLIIWNLQQNNVDYNLIEIITDHLGILYDTSNPKIKDWHQFNYIVNLANELSSIISLPKEGDNTLKIIKLLIGYDFNPLSFYEFMLEYSAKVASQNMPYEDQELELLALLKTIENIRPECKHGYNKDVMPIGESISGSIRRELETIERMRAVHFPNYQNTKNGVIPNFYFEINATLEELFFLIRIMLESHVIKTKFKSNLYTFTERHIRTARTKKPSPQYMRNIFGPKNDVPARIVKRIRFSLVLLINFIDSNFKDQLKVWTLGFIAILFQEDLINLCSLVA
ncbi:hypothetical protein QG516_21250 [Pedobacter gandavensis]|uniref:hypothetical protein n=1 Tax=Pedobacter TaxID=84567 RepID=UPI001C99392A|nr:MULTISPECIES: hypothetical protein [Pedobacter]WGQ09041.1 hypothetical protein QG516_21250 [Pedobacter gandavensis]